MVWPEVNYMTLVTDLPRSISHIIWKWWSGRTVVCWEELHTLTSFQKPIILFLIVCTCTFDHIHYCLVRLLAWPTFLRMSTLRTEIITFNSSEELLWMKFIRSENISNIVLQLSSVFLATRGNRSVKLPSAF